MHSVLQRNVPHHHAIQQLLEQDRRKAGRHPRVLVELPADPRVRDLAVRPHPLASYDDITQGDRTASSEEDANG